MNTDTMTAATAYNRMKMARVSYKAGMISEDEAIKAELTWRFIVRQIAINKSK